MSINELNAFKQWCRKKFAEQKRYILEMKLKETLDFCITNTSGSASPLKSPTAHDTTSLPTSKVIDVFSNPPSSVWNSFSSWIISYQTITLLNSRHFQKRKKQKSNSPKLLLSGHQTKLYDFYKKYLINRITFKKWIKEPPKLPECKVLTWCSHK